MRPIAGTVLAERYRLTALLGEGGMGEVWAARHVLTGKAVAVKQLTCGAHERHFGEARARFAREARSACAVDHPNVVEVYDFVEAADRSPFMVMELLQGETLAARLARGPLSMRELGRTMLPVVSAVGTAHARGIVHRDLKPSNIFLDVRPQDGSERVKVLDFGIAKWLAADADDPGLRTRTGSTLGTPSYMAPEQATGDRAADHRVDVWSLGVILYEACSGARPIEGDNAAQLVMRLLSTGIIPIEQLVPELPRELAALIGRMLTRDVARRPTDLREVYTLLCELAGEESVPFGPPAPAVPERSAAGSAALGGASGTGVDAFARTIEPALAADPAPQAIELRPSIGAPTRTASSVPDALVALETRASAPARDDTTPLGRRQRWVPPLGLAALALAAASLTFMLLRAGANGPVRAAVAPLPATAAAAPAVPVDGEHEAPTPADPSTAPIPRASALGAEAAAAPRVTRVEGLPQAADARRAPRAPRRQRRAPEPSRPAARAAPRSQGPASTASGEGERSPAVTQPPPPKARGAECASSSECASRLCVAYACR